MNREELYESIGGIDEDLLERSEKTAASGKRVWKVLLPLAACFGVLLLSAALLGQNFFTVEPTVPTESTEPSQQSTETTQLPTASTIAPTTAPTEPVTDGTIPQDSITTEKYTLFWENEKCYMQGHPENSNSFEGETLGKAHYPVFSSLREMQQKLKNGDLAEEEIAELMRYAPKDTNIVEICNINKLYEAIYPEDIEVEYIMFTGRGYTYELGNGTIGYIYYLCQDDYESLFEDEYNFTIGGPFFTVLSVEQVADRNAEVLRYDNGILGMECRRVRYTNETDHGTQYVLEVYEGDTLSSVNIYGMSNGAYYSVFIAYPEERPSLEWLSSFGLREYVETEVS